jgi:hypothetical protein
MGARLLDLRRAVEVVADVDGPQPMPAQQAVRPEGGDHQDGKLGRVRPLGLAVAAGEKLDPALIEYATMLEDVNRFVSAAEAQRVAGLSDELFGEMRRPLSGSTR